MPDIHQLRKSNEVLYNACVDAQDWEIGLDDHYIVMGMCEDLARINIPDVMTEEEFLEIVSLHDCIRDNLRMYAKEYEIVG